MTSLVERKQRCLVFLFYKLYAKELSYNYDKILIDSIALKVIDYIIQLLKNITMGN